MRSLFRWRGRDLGEKEVYLVSRGRACKVFCVIKVPILAIHWLLVDGAAILLEWAEENNVCCLIDKRCVVGMCMHTK